MLEPETIITFDTLYNLIRSSIAIMIESEATNNFWWGVEYGENAIEINIHNRTYRIEGKDNTKVYFCKFGIFHVVDTDQKEREIVLLRTKY